MPIIGATLRRRLAPLPATPRQLTNTEAQIAQPRQAQARDEAVREELATNATNAQERAQLIAGALRDLGGVPDVVTLVLGRATPLAKTVVEHAVEQLTDTAALTALLRYEQNHNDRAGAVTGIENRQSALAEQDVSRN